MDNSQSIYDNCSPSWSDLAWDAAKGCAGGVAFDLSYSALTAPIPGAMPAACIGGAIWNTSDTLMDTGKCYVDSYLSNSSEFSQPSSSQGFHNPYELDVMQDWSHTA
jgi:hypothetical protein